MPTKKSSKKRLILLDAHAIIHRAYHALPDFSNSKGEPTGALYGVSAMLIKIIQELKPDYVAACYDLPEPTFRHEAYEEYKSGRQAADDALIEQLDSSRKVFEAFGVPMYEEPGFEADDILGTIVEKTKKKQDLEVIIASGDMDTLQLVDEGRVKVYTLRKGLSDTVMYDEDAVVARFGFGSDLLPDYKGLRGDPSDNIIGIKGIGEKSATELIQKFGTIEEMYKALKKKGGEEAFIEAGIKKRIVGLLQDGEEEALFSKTLATIRRDAPVKFEVPKQSWEENLDIEKIEKLFAELEFRTLLARVKSVFGTENEEEESGAPSDGAPEKGPSDQDILETGIALWLINSDTTNPDLDDILQYAGTKDFAVAKDKIMTELKEKKLNKVYEEIELPIIPMVAEMQENGITLDLKYLDTLSKEYHKELDKLQKSIYNYADGEFNINSPKQLGEVLFDKLGLTAKGLKKTAGGARSTRESELLKLKGEHDIVARILEYRELQKLLSTYIDTFPKLVAEDDRLHAEFLQAGTTTGRFSSHNPNIQNIPIRSELGRNIRNAFIAPQGWKLASFDYSQIELRVAAILSQDEALIDIFREGHDVHAAVASRVFDVPENKVTHEMRRKAKVINFGIIYGMGVNALRQNLGGTRDEAQNFLTQYFRRFPGVKEYLEHTKSFALKHGYTETLLGRRRYFPSLKSRVPFIRAAAERMATNAPIQGTATADIIKLAIKHVDAMLVEKKLKDKVKLVLQIHDELMYEIKNDVVDELVPLIECEMEAVLEKSFIKFKSDVPLEVSVSVADTWGKMK